MNVSVASSDRVYIAGGMRGYQFYNFPTFFEAEFMLNERGYEAVNPAAIDMDSGFSPYNLPDDHDWNTLPPEMNIRAVIRRDILALLTCDWIYLLPGWARSTGARCEFMVARWAGIKRLKL